MKSYSSRRSRARSPNTSAWRASKWPRGFFTEIENQKREMVCVIGGDIAEKFFPHVGALGKEILVDDKPIRVIGVLAKQDSFFIDGGNQNRAVYVPYQTIRKMYPKAEDHFVMAQAAEGKMSQGMDEITQVLRRRREVPYDKSNNFGLSSPDAMTDQFHQITGA
jgi:putative ABC transport system permease protein